MGATRQELEDYAQTMRLKPTPAEKIVAERLTERGILFYPQYIIAPYIVDFVIPEKMVIIELDGSGHDDPDQKLYDERRDKYLEALGFKVFRFWNHRAVKWDFYELKQIRTKCISIFHKTMEGPYPPHDRTLAYHPRPVWKKPAPSEPKQRQSRAKPETARAAIVKRYLPCPICHRRLRIGKKNRFPRHSIGTGRSTKQNRCKGSRQKTRVRMNRQTDSAHAPVRSPAGKPGDKHAKRVLARMPEPEGEPVDYLDKLFDDALDKEDDDDELPF